MRADLGAAFSCRRHLCAGLSKNKIYNSTRLHTDCRPEPRITPKTAKFSRKQPKRGSLVGGYPPVYPCIPLCTPPSVLPVSAIGRAGAVRRAEPARTAMRESQTRVIQLGWRKVSAKSNANLKCTSFGHLGLQTRNQGLLVLDRDLLAPVMLLNSLVARSWRFVAPFGTDLLMKTENEPRVRRFPLVEG